MRKIGLYLERSTAWLKNQKEVSNSYLLLEAGVFVIMLLSPVDDGGREGIKGLTAEPRSPIAVCITCRKRSKCKKLCERMEQQLKQLGKQEGDVSANIDESEDQEGVISEEPGDEPIDDSEDQEDRISREAEDEHEDEPRLDRTEQQRIDDRSEEGRHKAIPPEIIETVMDKAKFTYREKELKRWFRSFLKCSTITRIAELAGCTKQNIYKRFVKIIFRIAELLEHLRRGEGTARVLTPSELKRRLKVKH